MKKPKKIEKPKPYRANKRFGILNHLGWIWTPETFESKELAERYLAIQRAAYPFMRLEKHKVVSVRVTVSIVSAG